MHNKILPILFASTDMHPQSYGLLFFKFFFFFKQKQKKSDAHFHNYIVYFHTVKQCAHIQLILFQLLCSHESTWGYIASK